MKLYEFFGNIDHDVNQEQNSSSHGLEKEEEKQLADHIFWYMLDNDRLHKKYFLPIAKQIKKKHETDPKTMSHNWRVWIPMINRGCREYFEKHDIKGDPKDVFNKKFRMNLCKRMVEHHHKDILKDEYQLGH